MFDAQTYVESKLKEDVLYMPYENYIIFLMGFSGVGKRTIAQEIAQYPYFKLVDNHTINRPIISLLDMEKLNYRVPEKAWREINKIRDAVFTTIRELSPHHFSFVITHDMVEGEEYPKVLFDMVQQLANARQAYLLPVRLECDEADLIKRVSSIERKSINKITDTGRAISHVRNKKVFYSKHPNEITINNTNKSAKEVAEMILDTINRVKI